MQICYDLCGINDLIETVQKDLVKQVSIHNIMSRYASLHQVICRRNKHATILVSSVLLHANCFDLFFPLIYGLNFELEKWCAQLASRRVFVASHRLFLRGGRPKVEQFSKSDGLHPNESGTDILEAFLQQAMLPQFILQQLYSKWLHKLSLLTY